jgi:SAM-dependent methyltransferase
MSAARERGNRERGNAISRVESDYYTFMGYDPQHTAEGQRYYVRYFADGPVLDLGCGRGEFLGTLRDAGVECRGVDSDEGMVEAARAEGFDVALGDAVAALANVPAGSLGGVFCAHFLEHLPADRAEEVIASAAKALRPGGTFVAVVPNAACQAVMGHDFWRDPTHVRFYDPTLLSFYCQRAGLALVDDGGNPANHPGPPPETIPGPATIDMALDEEVARLVQLATNPRGKGKKVDPLSPWPQLGHLLATVMQRLRTTQEELSSLHLAHRQLIDRLWPSNEVYVVARA